MTEINNSEIDQILARYTQPQLPDVEPNFKSEPFENSSTTSDSVSEIQPDMESKFQQFQLLNNKLGQKNFKKKIQLHDRFIPLRKQSHLNIALTNAHEYINERENANPHQDEEPNQISIANLYKQHILHCKPFKNKQRELENFNNTNILRFNIDYNTQQKRDPLSQFTSNFLYDINQEIDQFFIHNQSKKISKTPYKVLDAPALQDDFYLNLLDWGAQNILAVGLSSCVYLWSAQTSKVSKLLDMGVTDSVCSVNWTQKGQLLTVGTNNGEVQIWDSVKLKKIRVLGGHQRQINEYQQFSRVGTLASNQSILTSGSRDKTILNRDLRVQNNNYISKLQGHKQEVCGLKWSPDNYQLASGGNDNKLYVWNLHSSQPIIKFNKHQAAVKALTWSPHQHGLLVSGGGTADRTIRFWNTLLSQQLDVIDTGSQVCNLIFSKSLNQLVSTHGYSQNQIIIWDYPYMEKIATLTGHTYRVLFLSISPDSETIVTGAGDETLRFWKVFPNNSNENDLKGKSLLLPSNNSLR